ncbi:hypothetical protein [Allorhizocola rhizosphaerae]|uniref:hypothetical protein n=1 Tax=Allorhizocola rhizosphaerae TaxID=1872709 RepID=UPI000E3B5D43|nr:hypothetical protein [Allorhizocola rhizosphaerae]
MAARTDSDTVGQAFFGSRVESDWREGSPITFTGEREGKTAWPARTGRAPAFTGEREGKTFRDQGRQRPEFVRGSAIALTRAAVVGRVSEAGS